MSNAIKAQVFLLVIITSAHLDAQKFGYVVTEIPTVGGSSSRSYQSNAKNEVAGYSTTPSATERATLWLPSAAYSLWPGTNDLGLPSGATYSRGYSVNGKGQVLGYADIGGNQRAVLWLPTAEYGLSSGWNDLGTLGGATSVARYFVQDSGVVVGGADDTAGRRRAFAWLPGSMFGLPGGMNNLGTLPGGLSSDAWGLNGSGEIVGDANTPARVNEAMIWLPVAKYQLPQGMSSLGGFGGQASHARAINNKGEVVGFSWRAGNPDYHALLWLPAPNHGLPAGLNDLGTLAGYDYSQARDINDAGQVVGWCMQTNPAGVAAFYWDASGLQNLNQLIDPASGWSLQRAFGISANGNITGYGTLNGRERGFLLTPVSPNLAATPNPVRSRQPLTLETTRGVPGAIGGVIVLEVNNIPIAPAILHVGAFDSNGTYRFSFPAPTLPAPTTVLCQTLTINAMVSDVAESQKIRIMLTP